MTTATTPPAIDSTVTPGLYMALELSNREWKLGFTCGRGQRPRLRTVAALTYERVAAEIAAAKQRFDLPADCPVVSCYEAGRDGFWVHRYLQSVGVQNLVVDSASIEVNRRRKRAKTDRLDTHKLLEMLLRYLGGERRVWSVVQVPSVAEEDARQLHRTRATLKQERTRLVNRLRGLLATAGVRRRASVSGLERWVEAVRDWDGQPLPPGLQLRLRTEAERLSAVEAQLRALEAERRRQQRSTAAWARQIQQLMQLRAVGASSAWVFVLELFSWRGLKNRRQLGALSGLVPVPFASGTTAHDQGISRAGNRLVRALAVEVAWAWLRYQPQSELSQWYQRRFGHGSSRLRRIGIVALARKLLIALWRYLETGALPAGALLKAAA